MISLLASTLVVTAAATAAAPLEAQSPPSDGTVIVLNKRGNDASFIDLASGTIVATLPTGPNPHELVVTSDGAIAIGSDYGGQTLTLFEVASASPLRTIDLGEYTRPHGLPVLPGDSLVAVTSEERGAVVIVRIADGTVVEVLETRAERSHMVAATRDGATLWTGDIGSHTLSELRRGADGPVRVLAAPEQPEAIQVTPDGSRVFAGSNATGRVTAWRTDDGTPTPVAEGFGWAYRIVLTPGVRQIIVPDLRGEVVRFFDGDDYTELGRMEFSGQGPQGAVMHADGRHLFLSLSAADRVAIIDVERRVVVGTLPTGSSPDGVAWSPVVVRR